MNQLLRHLTAFVARGLTVDERDAVLGDLMEVSNSAGRALGEVCALVLRREAALWRAYRPWVLLVGLVLPLGLLLSARERAIGGGLDLYLWIVQNRTDLDPVLLKSTGLAIVPGLVALAGRGLWLCIVSWSCGFVLAALSRRAIRIQRALFCVTPLFVGLLITRRFEGPYQYDIGNWPLPLLFYTLVLPLMLLITLVCLPSLWGIRQGLKQTRANSVSFALWLAAISMAITFRWPLPVRGPLQFVMFAVFWPLGYMITSSIHSWRRQPTCGHSAEH